MTFSDDHLLPANAHAPAPRDRQPLADKQATLNRSTQGQWHLYSSHRKELERLLVPVRPGGRICVLGAGNCNDLDLRWLAEVYREVHLVDIDPDALTRAVKFQKVEGCEKIHLHGSVDLTGLANRLGGWVKNPPGDGEIQSVMALAGQSPTQTATAIGGRFDMVLSPCVLSQLITPLRDSIGEGHRAFPGLMSAMRSRHFQLMLDLLCPGGRGVFACDLFSSASFPDLPRVTKDQLPSLMRTMLGSGKFFSGLDPASITGLMARDASIAPRLADPKPAPPWLWHLGLSKTYLVYAITFSRRG